MMLRTILITLATIAFSNCFAQQEIVLIGTMHTGSPGGERDLAPIRAALEKFNPEVICVEYPPGNDTSSIQWRYGVSHYADQASLMRKWQLNPAQVNKDIQMLLKDHTAANNVKSLMTLFSLYYALSDFSNADYQAFRIAEQINKDSTNLNLIKTHPSFDYLKNIYHKRFVYKEYPTFVFPLASRLNITHLYPIDDLSSMSQPHNDVDSLSDELKYSYRQTADTYVKRLNELPKGSNQLLFLNSEEIIRLSYDGLKMLPTWVSRNKKMALYIHNAAKANPGKRISVFFGAGHIGQIRKELQDLDKSYRVLTLSDIMK